MFAYFFALGCLSVWCVCFVHHCFVLLLLGLVGLFVCLACFDYFVGSVQLYDFSVVAGFVWFVGLFGLFGLPVCLVCLVCLSLRFV